MALSGFGLGLRAPHYQHVLNARPKTVDWFEIISENFLGGHAGYFDFLADLRQDYPLVPHGVALNLGSTDPLDREYLAQLKQLADHVDAPYVSDHISWTGVEGVHTYDLLPVPYTETALRHMAARARHVMDIMQRPLVLENPSSYVAFEASQMPEWEFVARLSEEAGVGVLLDLNNVYVGAMNHGYDARTYIDALPMSAIRQVHLAGHRARGSLRIDTHDRPVPPEVWALYVYMLRTKGFAPTLVEWDAEIPGFDVLETQLQQARLLAAEVL